MRQVVFGWIFAFALAFMGNSARAAVIATEDFDGTSTWDSDVLAVVAAVTDPDDPTQGLRITSGITPLGPDNVLFGQDLTNETGEPVVTPATITFDSVDISAYTNVVVSFEYDIDQFDTGDFIGYALSVVGGADDSGSFDGGVGGVDYDGTYTFNVDDAATAVSLSLVLDQNGATDSFEIDNFMIRGDIPEPASGALMGLGALALLRRRSA